MRVIGYVSPAVEDPFRAGQGGDLVRLFELMGDDGADGAGEAAADRVVGAEAGPALCDEDDSDVGAPGPFDEVDGGAGSVGQLENSSTMTRAWQSGCSWARPSGKCLRGGRLRPRRLGGGSRAARRVRRRSGVLVGPGAVEGGTDGPGDAVVAGPDTGASDPFVVNQHFRRHARAAGLPPIRVHDLRHSFATAALRANMNPKLVADRLGHSTVSITLNVYSDSIPEVEAAEATRVVGAILHAAPPSEAADAKRGQMGS